MENNTADFVKRLTSAQSEPASNTTWWEVFADGEVLRRCRRACNRERDDTLALRCGDHWRRSVGPADADVWHLFAHERRGMRYTVLADEDDALRLHRILLELLSRKPHGHGPVVPGPDGSDKHRLKYNNVMDTLRSLDDMRCTAEPKHEFLVDQMAWAASLLWDASDEAAADSSA